MKTPLLATKLFKPPSRTDIVPRAHLIKQLNEGLSNKLTLISAPAGFGKTTLVSAWVEQVTRPVAWLSLDEGDSDLIRFLTYFTAALQSFENDFGKGTLVGFQSQEAMNTEWILTSILNEITELSDDVILVLDDYHVIESQPVDKALAYLLDHLPSQLHLVITSRIDPSLPLSRIRVSRQMTEIRANDLRFTPDETTDFLNQVMRLNLSTQEINALGGRTEGWIAGLQLAALSIQGLKGSSEINAFVNRFAGSDRYIQDYLVDEVLRQCHKQTRDFLLLTAILHRMSASLCDAVTGMTDSQTILENLETANLFIIPLDNQRHWYRYHHLFSDLLNHRLHQTCPAQISELHRRASEWYEINGLRSDAIHHAFAAEDFEQAAHLIELAWRAMDRSFQEATWLGWVQALPDELVRNRPVLSAGYAWALLDTGELESAEPRLRDAERWLETTSNMHERPEAPSVAMVVADEDEFRSLPATIAAARAYLAQAFGDMPATVKYARQALDLLPEDDYFYRGIPAVILGLAHWASGDLEAAYQSFSEAVASFRRADNNLFAVRSEYSMAEIRAAQGRLHEAARSYKQILQLVELQGERMPVAAAKLHRGISEIHREWGDIAAATQHLLRTEELGKQAVFLDNEYRLCTAKARIKEAQGDLDGALDLLNEAERLYKRDRIPDVRPIAALKTRVWIVQGRLTEALGWVRECGLSIDDDLSYLCEFEHVTLARVLIAQYANNRVDDFIHDAMGLLERLLIAAEEGGRAGSVIEIIMLQALAHGVTGNVPPALVSLKRALTLAEPEGYVRLFVDEGPPMACLLYEALSCGIALNYVQRLLDAFPVVEPEQTGYSKTHPPQPELIEPLTERELEVLHLIAQGLTNRVISERLFLALDTVKGHNRRIYGKLGVQNRTEAVARARELALL